MHRRTFLFGAPGIAAALAFPALLSAGRAKAQQSSSSRSLNDVYARCARACRACEKACTACNRHCQAMVKAGVKQHARSLSLSADCRDLCGLAAKIVARKGPMSAAACDACARACDACGAECGKYPDMAEMKACAASCAVCAKACRDMIAATRRP